MELIENYLKEHEILYSGASFELGKIFWHILKADSEMEKKTYIEHPDLNIDNGDIKTTFRTVDELTTEFGREVLGEEIHWWVYQKEKNIDELKSKTEDILEFLQKLKEDSLFLKQSYIPSDYKELISQIKKFTDDHQKEINSFSEYVFYLKEKDIFAPCILFSTDVWSSSQASDRSRNIKNDDIEDDSDVVKKCTEIALGIQGRSRPIIASKYSEMSYELAERLDPSEYNKGHCIDKGVLQKRASHEILDELSVNFQKIRDSLRKILREIDNFNSEPNPIIRFIDNANCQNGIVKFALVQLEFSVSQNPRSEPFGFSLENEEKIKEKIFSALSTAKDNEVNVICFPELSFRKEWLDEITHEYNEMIIIGGSYYENAQNICPIIIMGELIEPLYAKCQSSSFENSPRPNRKMEPGKIIYVFQTRFGNFSVLNCIDYSKYSRYVINNGKFPVSFIINPCFDENMKRFEENCNLDCKDFNVTIIRVNKFNPEEPSQYGRSSIICKEHQSVIQNFQSEGFRAKDDVKYLLLKFDNEKMMILDIDIYKVPPVDLPTGYTPRISILNQFQYIEGNWNLDS